MKKSVRRAAVLAAAAVFLGSGAMLARSMLDYRTGQEAYAEAETLAKLPLLPARQVVMAHSSRPIRKPGSSS